MRTRTKATRWSGRTREFTARQRRAPVEIDACRRENQQKSQKPTDENGLGLRRSRRESPIKRRFYRTLVSVRSPRIMHDFRCIGDELHRKRWAGYAKAGTNEHLSSALCLC